MGDVIQAVFGQSDGSQHLKSIGDVVDVDQTIGSYWDTVGQLGRRTQFDQLYTNGTIAEKVDFILEWFPMAGYNDGVLLMTYWRLFDEVQTLGQLVDATPAESITRRRRELQKMWAEAASE